MLDQPAEAAFAFAQGLLGALAHDALAQGGDALSDFARQLLQQRDFLHVESVRLPGVDGQCAKGLLAIGQGEREQRVEPVLPGLLPPRLEGRVGQRILARDRAPCADRGAERTAPVRAVVTPGYLELRDIRRALACPRDWLDRVGLVLPRVADPRQLIAADLRRHAADFGHQRVFVGRVHDGVIAAGQHAVCAVDAAQRVLGAFALNRIAQRPAQTFAVDRALDEVVLCAACDGFQAQLVVVQPGQHDQRHGWGDGEQVG